MKRMACIQDFCESKNAEGVLRRPLVGGDKAIDCCTFHGNTGGGGHLGICEEAPLMWGDCAKRSDLRSIAFSCFPPRSWSRFRLYPGISLSSEETQTAALPRIS